MGFKLIHDSHNGDDVQHQGSGVAEAGKPTFSIAKSNGSEETYIYAPLTDDQRTRLLILHPGRFDQELRCSLKHVESLRDNPYDALSYTWGDQPKNRLILCSDKRQKDCELSITANLQDALRHLRSAIKPITLWVDAICINQDSILEKDRHIGRMRGIFAHAEQVVVWLGPRAESDELAFECLASLHNRLDSEYSSKYSAHLGWYRSESGRLYSGGAHRPMMDSVNYEHLINLLRRRWFHRVWVVQELASSKRAIVRCGDQMIKWEVLAGVYMGLGDHFLPVDLGGHDAHLAIESIEAIERARRSMRGATEMSLFQILVATSRNDCQRPSDKIFGVLGLAKGWIRKGLLKPSYEAENDENNALRTYKAFAVEDIRTFKQLRSLSCASGPDCALSLPSWVPDWRSIENSHPFTRYIDRTQFHASGSSELDAWFSDNENVLHIRGMRADAISALGPEPMFATTIGVFEITPHRIADIQRSADWLHQCREFARGGRGEFWKTMLCGLTAEGFPAPPRYADHLASYLKFVSGAADSFQKDLIEAEGLERGFRGTNNAFPNYEIGLHIEASLERWSSRRRLVITNDGRLACVPRSARKGDAICVLFGAAVPFILRPNSDGTHVIIGECYANGMMHGECLRYGIPSQIFNVR